MKQQLCYNCLTVFLIVFVPPVLTTLPCTTTVRVHYSGSSSEQFNNHSRIQVQPGHSVEVGCSGGYSYQLLKDEVQIDSSLPYRFNVTGEQTDKNETYTCVCINRRDERKTAQIVIQTIIPRRLQIIQNATTRITQHGSCVVIPCELEGNSTGLAVSTEWWYAQMSPSKKVIDVGRVTPRRGCDPESCPGTSTCVKGGKLVVPNVTKAHEEYVYWCTMRYTHTIHSKLQTISVSTD